MSLGIWKDVDWSGVAGPEAEGKSLGLWKDLDLGWVAGTEPEDTKGTTSASSVAILRVDEACERARAEEYWERDRLEEACERDRELARRDF